MWYEGGSASVQNEAISSLLEDDPVRLPFASSLRTLRRNKRDTRLVSTRLPFSLLIASPADPRVVLNKLLHFNPGTSSYQSHTYKTSSGDSTNTLDSSIVAHQNSSPIPCRSSLTI
mmetsp:Transcript_16553/g.47653  ORF Transcript_16553/g.47653 Transcript_16553/m.47653 type:complete len:116 (-) Transcript_16553:1330-1677(-)